MNKLKVLIGLFFILFICAMIEARPQASQFNENPDPSWMRRQMNRVGAATGRMGDFARRQLIRMGEAASHVGNKMGSYAVRLSTAVDKICALVKKVIPIIGAVCTVGQFKFCMLDNGTGNFAPDSISGPIAGPGLVDLNVQD